MERQERKCLIKTRLKFRDVRIENNIPSVDGMLYKDSIVKLEGFDDTTKKIRVIDSLGKIWWVEPSQISASFL